MGHEPQMTIARTRLLTLCYGDMETIRMVRPFSPQISYNSASDSPSTIPVTHHLHCRFFPN